MGRQGHYLHFTGGKLQYTEVLDQTHSRAWAAISSLNAKDIILRTPRSLLAHQSIALHFPQFLQFCFCACLENAVLRSLSHSVVIKYLCPSRHPHTSVYLRTIAWSYRYPLEHVYWKGLHTTPSLLSISYTPQLQEESTPNSNGSILFLLPASQSLPHNLPFPNGCANHCATVRLLLHPFSLPINPEFYHENCFEKSVFSPHPAQD